MTEAASDIRFLMEIATLIIQNCVAPVPSPSRFSYEEAGVPYSADLVLADESRRPHVALTSGGMELIIHRPAGAVSGSARSSVIGCREWARYYKQRPRPSADSNSRELAIVVSR